MQRDSVELLKTSGEVCFVGEISLLDKVIGSVMVSKTRKIPVRKVYRGKVGSDTDLPVKAVVSDRGRDWRGEAGEWRRE
jgi:hypothetical protein